jgi:putative hydrolase of the HAD superfamily
VSDEIGARKPSFAAFEKLQHTLAVPAERIAYVGDDPVPDICGASSAGMRAVWLDAEGRTYPQDVAEPDSSIASLTEFLALVPGPTL